MHPIRALRDQAGLTQQDLAEVARTSQPTIALYEGGAKSPTLVTLERLAASVGLDLVVTFTPHLTREDQRSLEYHRAIARVLVENSSATLRRARRTLKNTRARNPLAKTLLDRWNVWLKLPIEEIVSNMLDPGVAAREMRQVSPFAGLLSPRERAAILKRFRKDFKE